MPTLLDKDGTPVDVTAEQAAQLLDRPGGQWRLQTDADAAERLAGEVKSETYGGVKGAVLGGGAAVLSGGTLGISNAYIRAAGGGEQLRGYYEENPGITTAGEIVGAVATAIPSGGSSLLSRTPGAVVARLGADIAKAGEGASALTKIGRGVAGGFVEGGLQNVGSGISQLARSAEDLTVSHVASQLSSDFMYGGGVGGAIGGAGKVLGIGLSKGKAAIDDAIANRAATKAADDVAGDLGTLDVQGLRVRKQAVEAADDVAHKAELETLEQTRVVKRKEIADDLAKYRRESDNQWATTKDVKLAASEAGPTAAQIGRDAVTATNQLKKLLGDPVTLAEKPHLALGALRRQEQAYIQLTNRADDLKLAYAADDLGGKRLAALDQVPVLLERNRGLQAAIGELNAPLPIKKVSTAQLDAIANAKDALASGGSRTPGMIENAVSGTVFGAVTGAVGAVLPGIGHIVGAGIGAKVSKLVTDVVFGRLGKASGEAAARAQKAVSSFLNVAEKGVKVAPPLASRTLNSVRYAAAAANEKKLPKGTTAKSDTLADAYKARANEIRSQTAYGPDGSHVMRPDARQAMADRLSPIRAAQPILADRMESLAAKRIEFLASKLPKRPDMGGMQLGPDLWQPSDMEMRTFARYAAAVEDPHGVIERAAHGTVSPEDADAVRTVYPELLADAMRQIVEGLPLLRKALPYQRRLSLAILSGIPVDPSMNPGVLRILQGNFAAETGTAGGTQAPLAQANFGALGSASKQTEKPTPAQRRNA